jgi:hypothetical protein
MILLDAVTTPLYPKAAAELQLDPVRLALDQLGWYGDQVPTIELVDARPDGVSTIAHAWTLWNADGTVLPVIYVATYTEIYRAAERGRIYAIRQLAGMLAHERVHLQGNPREADAYASQLAALIRLHAPDAELGAVRRAMRAATRNHEIRRH